MITDHALVWVCHSQVQLKRLPLFLFFSLYIISSFPLLASLSLAPQMHGHTCSFFLIPLQLNLPLSLFRSPLGAF